MTLTILLSCIMSCLFSIQWEEGCRTVSFQEDTVSVIKNPCMGWGLYDDANGEVQQADTYWKAQDAAAREYASFFYVRWRWSDMEPEEGKYAWIYDENYKRLIQGALDRGLKLCFRIYNHSQDNLYQSTPDYVRQSGAKGYMAQGIDGKTFWTPYPDDPIFQRKLEKFVKALAAQYDNPDIVDFVDAYNIGWWGECHHVRLSKYRGSKGLEVVLDQISSIYSSHFHHVMLALPFNSQVGFKAEKEIAIDRKGYSMRRDGLGSMWYTDRERQIVQEMYGKTLLIGESCWWKSCSDDVRPWASDLKYKLDSWRDVYELTFQHAIEGHFNTLDLREIPETTGWTTRANDLVGKFCLKGGYRIHPTRISYPAEVKVGDSVVILHTWVNTGNGYLPNNVRNWNYKYKPAFALMDVQGNIVLTRVDKRAEPSSWLTGQEHHYSFRTDIPSLAKGRYRLAVAIVDCSRGYLPAIRLAVANAENSEGWTLIGDIVVK